MRLRMQIDKKLFVEYKTMNTPQDFEEFMSEFLRFQSIKIVERVKEVVRRRLYNWEPLSPSYVAFKKRMGLDPRTWIASGQVEEAVHSWYNPMSDSWWVGVHPTKRHRAYVKGGGYDPKKKGARIIDIIRWLEYGTKKMPARPLFTKVFDEFKRKSTQTALYSEFVAQRKAGKLPW